MVKFADRVKVAIAQNGGAWPSTGTIYLGSAAAGFQSVPTSLDGETIRYVIEHGTDWEIGSGTFNNSAQTVSRSLASSSTGSLLDIDGAADFFISPSAADLQTQLDSTNYSVTNYTASSGSNTFDASSTPALPAYQAGKLAVYVNGVLRPASEYTATYGTSVVMTLAANDEVSIVNHGKLTGSILDFTDTPSSLGTAGQILQMNSGATALEFADAATGGGGGSLEAVASGALANGDTVVVNSNGTVSAVATSSVSQAVGSTTTFESSETQFLAVGYDKNAQKIVVAYRDGGDGQKGKAVVGTVSGTTISFGTPVVFHNSSGTKVGDVIYDENAQKIVIFYNSAYAIVGTVSGTSISFGSAVQYYSGSSDNPAGVYDPSTQKVVGFARNTSSSLGYAAVGTISGTSISFGSSVQFGTDPLYTNAVYDSNAQKIVICWSDYGTSGSAVVGTVSGTSISFGSATNFTSNTIETTSISYDTSSQKIVIVYSDNTNSEYGTAIVGAVSGTSISFGTPIVFDSTKARNTTISYDSSANKHVIFYNRGYGSDSKFIVGTVSGTSMSFGSIVQAYNGWALDTDSVYDPNSDKVVVAFKNWSDSNYGTSIVFQNANSGLTNLTSQNYIGISDGAYADTATATIQIAGSVDDAQSGLSAGQKYYVQRDGSLNVLADSPSVVAGTAVSASKIIVKG